MGLVNKLKNILFEEEEVEVPVIEKKETKISEPVIREMPRKEEPKGVSTYNNFYNEEAVAKPPVAEKEVPVAAPYKEEIKTNVDEVSEREIFKSEKTFNFPSFDEEEFESSMPRRTTNVMEHERKKFRDKNSHKVEVSKKEENKEVKTKFKPSPIISPVYGILDKNYTPEEITTRETTPKTLDVDSVRKKAFGSLEDSIIDMPNSSRVDSDKEILEERIEKARTIDELLKDSSDDIIDVEDNFSNKVYDTEDLSNINLEDTLTDLNRTMEDIKEEELTETIDSLDELNEEEVKPQETVPTSTEEDSLESDLFDLIDSMYENREDGE